LVWSIEFAKGVEKDLRRLSGDDRVRIPTFLLDRVANSPDPRALAKRLVGDEWAGAWRFRVGPYRVIAEFHDQRLVVMVLEIGKRDAIYR